MLVRCYPKLNGDVLAYDKHDFLNIPEKDQAKNIAIHLEAIMVQCWLHSSFETRGDNKFALKNHYNVVYESLKCLKKPNLCKKHPASVVIKLLGTDLPKFATKEDYFKMVYHLFTTCTNQDGEVVPVDRWHIDYALSNLGKQDLYVKIYEYLTETAINLDVDDDEQVSEFDTDGKSDSDEDDDDEDDDGEGKNGGGTNTSSKTGKGKGKRPASAKKGNKSNKKGLFTKGGLAGMFGGSPFKITGNGRAMPTMIDISGKSHDTFKISGGSMEYSSVQVSRDPSLAVHWLNADVCAWEGATREHAVITKFRTSPALGFKVTPYDGPEFERWFSAEEVAQMALAFSIDAANTSPAMPTGTNIEDVMDAASTRLDKEEKALAGKMDRKANTEDIRMLAILESQHEQVDRTSFAMVSPGTAVSFIRWVSKLTTSAFDQVDVEATRVAKALALDLPNARVGVSMAPEAILAWAYFNVSRRSFQEMAPAISQAPSGIRSINDDKMVATMDLETGMPRYGVAAIRVKRKGLTSVGDIEEVIITLQHILLRFHNRDFAFNFIATMQVQVNEIKMEMGGIAFECLDKYLTYFLATVQSDLLRHLDEGLPFNSFIPLKTRANFDALLVKIRNYARDLTNSRMTAMTATMNSLKTQFQDNRRQPAPGSKRGRDDKQEQTSRDPRKKTNAQKKKERQERQSKGQQQGDSGADSAAHKARLAVATKMGFETVRACVSDFANKRKTASLPIECFWSTLAAEFGGPMECTNPRCPKCKPHSGSTRP